MACPREALCLCCPSRANHPAAPGRLAQTLGSAKHHGIRKLKRSRTPPMTVAQEPDNSARGPKCAGCRPPPVRARRRSRSLSGHEDGNPEVLVAWSGALRPSSLNAGCATSGCGAVNQCNTSVVLPERRPRGGSHCLAKASAGPARFGLGPRALPNPSLNTGPSAAGRLAREAPAVYAAPRGQAAPPLQAG